MIVLKSRADIDKMRAAGRVVARALRVMAESIVPGKTTLAELDTIAKRIVEEANGRPSFLNYRGFPASTCINVNDTVVHGIPDNTVLREGDIVGLDLGVQLDGWHADGAWTYPVGSISKEAQRLLNVTQESLFQGISKAKVGNRIGDIAAAVQKYVESNGYAVVRDLVGHGIGRNLHEEPSSVPNFGRAGRGELLREGTTICIEPMVNEGTFKVNTLPDKWTLKTAD
ncbi:MAG: methionyl aminopeptidase, partial [Fimbriimonadaceae bacterium]|nr:methionyl aminopeptidase [Fimbriimonadaceae bacterium]